MQAVIISFAKDESLRLMTQKAIDSAVSCGVKTVFVIEQKQGVEYERAITIQNTDVEFNYNRALNKGISCCWDEYIALCNNDVIFYDGFCRIENIMKENNIHSASPCRLNEDIGCVSRVGYKIKQELRGWCIVVDKYTLNKIGKLDETYTFHYSDNAYADQLKKQNIDHHLVNGVYLDHLCSVTLRTTTSEERRQLTKIQKFKYKKNGLGVHIQEGSERQPSIKVLPKKRKEHGLRQSVLSRRQAKLGKRKSDPRSSRRSA